MLIDYVDYNGADTCFRAAYAKHWAELSGVVKKMPLHLKASDQAGIAGDSIFDPVGTNAFIKTALVKLGWSSCVPIPQQFGFLGTDVDFIKGGVLGEAQFSNYPFLLNNVVRSELFHKAKLALGIHACEVVVIITKGKMFPASNSTLYFEQARSQLDELAKHKVFAAPIRLVGLQEKPGSTVSAIWTTYHAARYSRTVTQTKRVKVKIGHPRTARSRSGLQIIRA